MKLMKHIELLQTQQQHHRDSGYGSSPDSETKITEFDSQVH